MKSGAREGAVGRAPSYLDYRPRQAQRFEASPPTEYATFLSRYPCWRTLISSFMAEKNGLTTRYHENRAQPRPILVSPTTPPPNEYSYI